MKTTSYNGNRQRQVLLAMIVNDSVLGRVSAKWNGGRFASPWENRLAGWCVDHWREYGKAPRKDIMHRFRAWSETLEDNAEVEHAEGFLSGLNREWELNGELNVDLTMRMAGELFNENEMRSRISQIEAYLQQGKTDKAIEVWTGMNRVQLGDNTRTDIMSSGEQDSTFDAASEQFIEYPGDLGSFFRDTWEREAFVAVVAPEKTGKSWWLIDIAWRAVLQRRRVAFFECGDMSKRQLKKRLYTRIAKHPCRSTGDGWPCTVEWPTEIKVEGNEARVRHKEIVFEKPLDLEMVRHSCRKAVKEEIKSHKPRLLLSCHSAGAVGVPDIKSVLHEWELEDGWTPDVAVIDYADLLAPPPGKLDFRHATAKTWESLRALSLDRHCLVVTATQANREGVGRRTMDRRNLSEDKRKLSYVTGMFGVNVWGKEKRQGVARLNWWGVRDRDYYTRRVVWVAGCLALGQPAVLSSYPER